MIAVRMVQVTIDEIVDVIPVRHRLVAATRTMLVRCVVTGADMVRGACCRIGGRHLDHMLVDVITVHVMQMAVVKIVDVPVVLHSSMAAPRTMNMGMVGVSRVRAVGHRLSPIIAAMSGPQRDSVI
jgi:hypothetical protein